MDSATKYMQAAIDSAVEREAEIYGGGDKRQFPGHCSGFADTPLGELAVHYTAAQGRTTWRRDHMRKGWKLSGKVISQANLIKALNEI